MPKGDVVQNVEPRDALLVRELCGVALPAAASPRGYAGVGFVALRALHVPRIAVCRTRRNASVALVCRAAALLFDAGVIEVVIEVTPQLWQIGAAGAEDTLAVGS